MSVYASRCLNCGSVVKFKRHSFVTFGLWLCAIINGLCVIGYFALLFSSKGLWTRTPEPTWLRLMWLTGFAVCLCAYIMLIKWNKKGFYLCFGMCVVNMIINFIVNGISLSVLSPISGILILYGILQIKRDGVEYWEAMDIQIV